MWTRQLLRDRLEQHQADVIRLEEARQRRLDERRMVAELYPRARVDVGLAVPRDPDDGLGSL